MFLLALIILVILAILIFAAYMLGGLAWWRRGSKGEPAEPPLGDDRMSLPHDAEHGDVLPPSDPTARREQGRVQVQRR
jgi:hypothetical protein